MWYCAFVRVIVHNMYFVLPLIINLLLRATFKIGVNSSKVKLAPQNNQFNFVSWIYKYLKGEFKQYLKK